MTEAGFISTTQYEMLQEWEPMVRAAGFWTPDIHPFSSFLMAKNIMDYLHKKWIAQRVAGVKPTGKARGQAYIDILNAMTPAEKEEMKQAINANHTGGMY
jgi:hypothetical protein